MSDINLLLDSVQHDFQDMVKIHTIGYSYLKRPIRMATLDAREFIVRSKHTIAEAAEEELRSVYHSKPAIVITGQHHSREVITSS